MSSAGAVELPAVSIDVDNLVDIEAPELVAAKRSLLSRVGGSSFDWNSWDRSLLLPALRIYHFNDRELVRHREYLLYDVAPFFEKVISLGVVSPRNEQRCLIFLWKRLAALQGSDSSVNTAEIQSQLRLRMHGLLSAHPSNMVPEGTVLNDSSSSKFHEYVSTWRFQEQNSTLKLADFGGVRGLLTERTIEASDPILRLPVEHIFGYHCIANSPLQVLLQVEGLPSEVALGLFLIFEFYNDSSPWRAYLDMLPMEFDTALYYTEAEIAQVSYSPLCEEIQRLQQKNRDTFDAVVPVLMSAYPQLFHPKVFVMENWVWAQSVIDSRGISLNINGEASLCLLPLVDAINGTTVSFLDGVTSVTVDSESKDAYTIRSLVPLEAGSQITMCYGSFSNRELLLYYGYVDHSGVNEYDTFSFDLDVEDGAVGELQTFLLAKLDLSLDQHLAFDGTASASTLMTMHLLLMTPEELLELERFTDTTALGQNILQAAIKSAETRQSLRSILHDLQARICLPDASSSSTPIRLQNAHHYIAQQRQILRKAVQKLM